METILGINIRIWDCKVRHLLEFRKCEEELEESEQDSNLPYFATRTLASGMLGGSLADLALLIWYGDYMMLGDLSMGFALKAFELASGLKMDWSDPKLEADVRRLRELSD